MNDDGTKDPQINDDEPEETPAEAIVRAHLDRLHANEGGS